MDHVTLGVIANCGEGPQLKKLHEVNTAKHNIPAIKC